MQGILVGSRQKTVGTDSSAGIGLAMCCTLASEGAEVTGASARTCREWARDHAGNFRWVHTDGTFFPVDTRKR